MKDQTRSNGARARVLASWLLALGSWLCSVYALGSCYPLLTTPMCGHPFGSEVDEVPDAP